MMMSEKPPPYSRAQASSLAPAAAVIGTIRATEFKLALPIFFASSFKK